MAQGEGRDLERLQPAHRIDQRPRELARPLGARLDDALEVGDVDAAAEDLPLAPPDEGPGVGALDLLEAGDRLVERGVGEQVERRVVEDQLGDRAVALEPDRRRGRVTTARSASRIRSAIAAISSAGAPRGIQGSFSGSSS